MGRIGKRLFDIAIALFLLLMMTPVLLITMLIMWITEGWPLFYVSHRHNTVDKTFRIYKLRSMVRDATNEEKYGLYRKYFREGFLDIPLDADVYTKIGRFIERTQLVELPQLINVLKGDMSIVGNRPLPTKNLETLKSKPCWEQRFDSPPGISGITQIAGKHSLTPDTRLELECLYSQVYTSGRVLSLDVVILYKTVILIALDKMITTEEAFELCRRYLKQTT